MGRKDAKGKKGAVVDTIFKTYSNGVSTGRDAWAYNFNRNVLVENVERMLSTYNLETLRWTQRIDMNANVDDFVISDDEKIKWSETLKRNLRRGKVADFSTENVRASLYRPFTKSNLYFDRMMNERVYVFPSIFPTAEIESENRIICVPNRGWTCRFLVLFNQCNPKFDDNCHRWESMLSFLHLR